MKNLTKNPVEYREDWDKKPFPPSKATEGAGDKGSSTPAPQITDNVEGAYFLERGVDVKEN